MCVCVGTSSSERATQLRWLVRLFRLPPISPFASPRKWLRLLPRRAPSPTSLSTTWWRRRLCRPRRLRHLWWRLHPRRVRVERTPGSPRRANRLGRTPGCPPWSPRPRARGGRRAACLGRSAFQRRGVVAEVPADAAVQTDGAVCFSSFIADSRKEAFAAAIRALSPDDRGCLDVAYLVLGEPGRPVGLVDPGPTPADFLAGPNGRSRKPLVDGEGVTACEAGRWSVLRRPLSSRRLLGHLRLVVRPPRVPRRMEHLLRQGFIRQQKRCSQHRRARQLHEGVSYEDALMYLGRLRQQSSPRLASPRADHPKGGGDLVD